MPFTKVPHRSTNSIESFIFTLHTHTFTMQVAKIQGMFLDKVKQGLSKDALCLESNPEKRDGLAVAFVVNTARMQADIKRDLEKGGAATCNFKIIKC